MSILDMPSWLPGMIESAPPTRNWHLVHRLLQFALYNDKHLLEDLIRSNAMYKNLVGSVWYIYANDILLLLLNKVFSGFSFILLNWCLNNPQPLPAVMQGQRMKCPTKFQCANGFIKEIKQTKIEFQAITLESKCVWCFYWQAACQQQLRGFQSAHEGKLPKYTGQPQKRCQQ